MTWMEKVDSAVDMFTARRGVRPDVLLVSNPAYVDLLTAAHQQAPVDASADFIGTGLDVVRYKGMRVFIDPTPKAPDFRLGTAEMEE